MMDNDCFKFDFSLEEMRLIISALAELPFKNVFETIGKINENANLSDSSDRINLYLMEFKESEVQLIVASLATLPFQEVFGLMGKINAQLEN